MIKIIQITSSIFNRTEKKMRKNESASSLFERKPTKQFDTPLNLYPNKLHAWMK